jgi:glycosyltransferase involved in cell wall biosynthesis
MFQTTIQIAFVFCIEYYARCGAKLKIVGDADLMVGPSKSIEDLIRVAAPQARTQIISNAIDTDTFKPRDRNPGNLLVVTRMFERKGVQYTLRALAQMRGQLDVNIVGDGPYLPTLKSLAKELGVDARFWGHIDNDSQGVKDLYERAAIFVFISEVENFPLVLLEAMIAGAAIITSSDNRLCRGGGGFRTRGAGARFAGD